MPDRSRVTLAAAAATFITCALTLTAQPNPYTPVDTWAQLPAGRTMGSLSAVGIDPKGNIWAAERCGQNSCAGRSEAPILQFDPSGKLLKSFGENMFVFPHGFDVDREGNVWVTDARGQDGKGHQVFKFSPDGKVLLTLGKAGVPGDGPDTFNEPSDVVVAPNGDIFVADGHDAKSNARIVKFSKDGKFIKTWGTRGTEPGQVRYAARARDRFARPAVRRRPRQQPHPDLRSGRQVPRGVEAVQPAERHLHRQERRDLRRRLRVEHASAIRAGSAGSASATRKTAR